MHAANLAFPPASDEAIPGHHRAGCRGRIIDHGAWIMSQGSPENALRWMDGIEDAIHSLARLPKRYPIAPESEFVGIEVRHFVFKSHRVIYQVDRTTVHVLHVRHAARRPWGMKAADDKT